MYEGNKEYKRIKDDPGFIRSDARALALLVSIVTKKDAYQAFLALGFHSNVKYGEKVYKGKYTEGMIIEAIEYRKHGMKWKEIGGKFGVNNGSLRAATSRYLRLHDKRE